jgi:tetratricopeptide (TPR) repeat protein
MAVSSLDLTFAAAVEHQRNGRLREAQAVFQQILSFHPRHADSLHMLGILAYQSGQIGAAIDLIGKAISIAPGSALYYANLGMVLAAAQHWELATTAYEKAIELWPQSAEAHAHLGYVLKNSGRLSDAMAAYRRAIELRPDFADAWNNLGNVLLESGEPAEATGCFAKAIALAPNDSEKHNNLGNALQAQERLDEAIASFRTAISLHADFPEALVNLGTALLKRDQAQEAIDVLGRAIVLSPDYADAHSTLASALHKVGRREQSIASFHRALELRPDHATALNNLGVVLLEERRSVEAIEAFRRLLALSPRMAEPHINLGNALLAEGVFDEALAMFEQARALDPDHPQTLSNLANAYAGAFRFDEARGLYRHAMELAPDFAEARWNLSLMQLLLGDYEQGWQNYEARWDVKARIIYRRLSEGLWDGSDLRGKRIFLHAEQGFGDAIQFVRYVPLVTARGGRVILWCQPQLRRLFSRVRGVEELISGDEPTPPFDFQCPLMTLPLRFGTTLQTIPADVPYLAADRDLVRKWQERLSRFPHKLKVGIAWTGSSGNSKNRERSIDLDLLAPLLRTQAVAFFSLQKDMPQESVDAFCRQSNLVDWTAEFVDFADTAALMAALDLVITIDTSVAHLAGALGKPVWVLLSYGGDWRYLLDREDSPWYPTMRFFRQRERGKWQGVVERAAGELTAWVKRGA